MNKKQIKHLNEISDTISYLLKNLTSIHITTVMSDLMLIKNLTISIERIESEMN